MTMSRATILETARMSGGLPDCVKSCSAGAKNGLLAAAGCGGSGSGPLLWISIRSPMPPPLASARLATGLSPLSDELPADALPSGSLGLASLPV